MSETRIVIPARYASRRLPGKLLLDLGGDPVIWHVVRRAREAAVGPVLVAADDERIVEAVRRRGGEARLVDGAFRNGTERVAAVARELDDAEIWIDLQGDEPLIEPGTIRALHRAMVADETREMATAVAPLPDRALWDVPSLVKVERAPDGRATAFWRTPPPGWQEPQQAWSHLGIYAFRRAALLALAGRPPDPDEQAHSLEQLRALGNGLAIHAVVVERAWPSINTAEDLEQVRLLMREQRAAGRSR